LGGWARHGGHQSALAKDNMQLPGGPGARELGAMVLSALEKNRYLFRRRCRRGCSPLFNRYQGGQSFGTHVDNAIRQVTGTPHRIRTDLSATLFLTNPTNTTAANCGGRYLWNAQRQTSSGPPDPVSFYKACISAAVTRGARLARFSGFKAWSVTMASARCCSIGYGHSALNASERSTRRRCSDGVYHNLLRRWRRCERVIGSLIC